MISVTDLTDTERKAFLESLIRPDSTRERRMHVTARSDVLRGQFKNLLASWVHDIYEDPEVISDILKHTFAIYNPLKRAANRLAVAYSRRPRRTLKGRKTATKQLVALMKELRYDRRARIANRQGVALNTIIALPLVRRATDGSNTIEVRFVHGGNSEPLFHDNSAKHAAPAVLGWMSGPVNYDRIDDPIITVADEVGWSRWNMRMEMVGPMIPHNLGRFPGVQMHLSDDDEDEDWYDGMVNSEILEATKRVALVAASMDWTRKAQCRKLLSITEQEESAAGEHGEAQTLHAPEDGIRLRGEGISMAVHDFSQAVEPFLAQIRALSDESLEIMTGSVSTLTDPDPANPPQGAANAHQRAALMHHQEEQLSEVEPFDAELVPLVVRLAAMVGMDAPSADMVADRLQTEYAEVPYIEEQRARLEYHILATKFGVSDQVEWMREQHGLTEEEALERLEHMAERRNRIRVPLVKGNTAADPTQEPEAAMPGESLPARQGRAGGRASPPSEAEAART